MACLIVVLALALGGTSIVLGEAGDAPELMLLGLVILAAAATVGVRIVRLRR